MKIPGLLRQISDDEVELVRTWRNAPSVRSNMYTRHEIGRDEHLSWWERTRTRTDQQYRLYEEDGTPQGLVAFTAIDSINHNAAWAFFASPDAPRGIGSRMEVQALDMAFGTLTLHKLYCEVLAFNTAVIKLHQRFGFQVEGIFRQQHLVEGEFIDIYRLGIFATEWAAKRPGMIEKVFR